MVRIVLEAARHGGSIVAALVRRLGPAGDADIAEELGLPRPDRRAGQGRGARAARRRRRGIRAGDVILALDGHEIEDPGRLRFRVATLPLGQPAPLAYWRDGASRTATVTVGPAARAAAARD